MKELRKSAETQGSQRQLDLNFERACQGFRTRSDFSSAAVESWKLTALSCAYCYSDAQEAAVLVFFQAWKDRLALMGKTKGPSKDNKHSLTRKKASIGELTSSVKNKIVRSQQYAKLKHEKSVSGLPTQHLIRIDSL